MKKLYDYFIFWRKKKGSDDLKKGNKKCLDCGDTFLYKHRNQLYCPEKNGIKGYCKYEAKYKLIQKKRKILLLG